MKLALGIDAGGTYTDVVLFDPASNRVWRKAKALTTPHDLSLGIARAVDNLDGAPFDEVKLVSISTTHATNAIVERRGGRVGLLLIGYDEEIMQRSGLEEQLPVEGMCYLAGGHDVKGEEVCPLDTQAAHQAVFAFRDRVDAFAVSGYFSVMNPEHEQRVRQIINDLTDAPVVCGHELTSKLNALKRVSTTVLNARLLPMIQQLLDSVKLVLAGRGIAGPLMVVKGDGSLVDERIARLRPVDTILSGPAASAIGARYLAGLDRCIVVDMGGTTTDIAVLEDGLPWTNPAGATVGGWQTSIRAADLRTVGLGGDSHIWVERGQVLHVGPRRAIPLCLLGVEWPGVVRELEGTVHSSAGEIELYPTDFLTVARLTEGLSLNESDGAILRALRHGPLSIHHLRETLDCHHVPSERLEELGVLRRASLTPTDLLWADAMGANGAAAAVGARIVAKQLGFSVRELTERVVGHIVDKVVEEILDKLVADQTGHSLFPAPQGWDYLLKRALGHGDGEGLNCQLQLCQPIVAIGAPVEAILPHVADKLHTSCVIPPHAEVGNAVGAVVAGVTYTVEVRVQPLVRGAGTATYLVHSPLGREEVLSFAIAVRRAEAIATELARKAAYRAGAKGVAVTVDRKKVTLGKLYEMTVRACASGQPRMAD